MSHFLGLSMLKKYVLRPDLKDAFWGWANRCALFEGQTAFFERQTDML